MLRYSAAIVALGLLAGTAFAQTNEGLVTVNVSNVANDIAKNLSIDVSQVPLSIQVPVGIAANVCGVDANVLAKQKQGGTAACDATSTNNALQQVVQKQLKG